MSQEVSQVELYTVLESATGEIRRWGGATFAQAQELQAGEALYFGAALSSATHYFADGLPVEYSEGERLAKAQRPRHASSWSNAAMAWQDLRTAQQLREHHLRAIEAERERRIQADIEHGGATFQAAARDQKNMSDKLVEIYERERLGTPMPEQLLVWRDKDNVNHAFQTQEDYAAWLGGMVVAIAQRGTEAYAWSWGKKGALAGLGDDVEMLRAFSVTG